MNTVVTSKEAILHICKELVSENGLSALNMRRVAQECKVALGSLYNYFPSKTELMIATIESVWQDIFHSDQPAKEEDSFLDYVQKTFERITAGMIKYPNFFTAHSIGFASEEKGQAREMMEQYFEHMKSGLLQALEQDPMLRPDAFNESFSKADFVDFVLSGLVALLLAHKSSCTVILELIRRSLYEQEEKAQETKECKDNAEKK